MSMYKVTFDDNIPISSMQTDAICSIDVKIENPEGKRIIKWIIIKAESELESFKKANKIAINLLSSQYM